MIKLKNDDEIKTAILIAHGKTNTFIAVNRVTDAITDNPDKFPILSKETVKQIKGTVTRYCNRQHWIQSTTKHTSMVFQRPATKKKR